MSDWAALYGELAERVVAEAPRAAPVLTGFGACVDAVYRLDGTDLDRLAAEGGPLLQLVVKRIAAGRDGELVGWADRFAVEKVLGMPSRCQLGGTGPQVSWTLAALGAPSVMALADRSTDQLAVLPPSVGVCHADAVIPVEALLASDAVSAKPPHYILEFTEGTRWSQGTIPRSSRLILRIADDGLEHDPAFASLAPELAKSAGAGLISGMNGIPRGATTDWDWLDGVVSAWHDHGLPLIHLELAEYAPPVTLRALATRYAGRATSLGLNLTELRNFGPVGRDPARAAHRIAETHGFDRVLVHADRWSLIVHRANPAEALRSLATGNLLAAARARTGAPTADLTPPPNTAYTRDHPSDSRLPNGWSATVAPVPYVTNPTTTVGLGDSFTAGVLLADSVSGL